MLDTGCAQEAGVPDIRIPTVSGQESLVSVIKYGQDKRWTQILREEH